MTRFQAILKAQKAWGPLATAKEYRWAKSCPEWFPGNTKRFAVSCGHHNCTVHMGDGLSYEEAFENAGKSYRFTLVVNDKEFLEHRLRCAEEQLAATLQKEYQIHEVHNREEERLRREIESANKNTTFWMERALRLEREKEENNKFKGI